MARRLGDRGLFLVAAAAASLAALVLLVAPLDDGDRTLVEGEDPGIVAWTVVLPLLLALLPLALPVGSRRAAGYASGGVILVMCFVSIGVFFLVPAILLLVAAARTAQAPRGA